jgi:hypothetical protein
MGETSANILRLRVNELTTGIYNAMDIKSGATAVTNVTGQTTIRLNVSGAANVPITSDITFHTDALQTKIFGYAHTAGGASDMKYVSFYIDTASPLTSVQFYLSTETSNILTGSKFTVYGVKA